MSREENTSNQPADDARLELQDVTVGYNEHTALEAVTLDIPQGAQVAVVGQE